MRCQWEINDSKQDERHIQKRKWKNNCSLRMGEPWQGNLHHLKQRQVQPQCQLRGLWILIFSTLITVTLQHQSSMRAVLLNRRVMRWRKEIYAQLNCRMLRRGTEPFQGGLLEDLDDIIIDLWSFCPKPTLQNKDQDIHFNCWICGILIHRQTGGGGVEECNRDSGEDECYRRNNWKHCLARKSKLCSIGIFAWNYLCSQYANVQGAAEKEHSSSLAIAFLLFTLILTIFMIHAMLQVCNTVDQLVLDNFSPQIKFHYLPESLAIVFLGAVLGLLMTALPEAETKRVRFIIIPLPFDMLKAALLDSRDSTLYSRWRPFPPQCSSSSSCPPSSLSPATIFTRATFFRSGLHIFYELQPFKCFFFVNRTLGASWCLPSSARPYQLLWLVVASIC